MNHENVSLFIIVFLFFFSLTIKASEEEEIITFTDNTVASICLTKWDTNSDGKLSKAEVAAVTDLGNDFKGKEIINFKELQYFTGLTTLAESTFEGCKKLKNINLPPNITSIGNYAFKNNYVLTNTILPASIERIGEGAFYSCVALKEVVLPNSLKYLGTKAFYYCSGIKALFLPSSIEEMESNVFYGCTGLTSVTTSSKKPLAILSSTFSTSIFKECTLNVPFGCRDIYRVVDVWKQFKNIEEFNKGFFYLETPLLTNNEDTWVNGGFSGDDRFYAFVIDFTTPICLSFTDVVTTLPDSFDFQILINELTEENDTVRHYRILGFSPTNTLLSNNIGNFFKVSIHSESISNEETIDMISPTYVDEDYNTVLSKDGLFTFEILSKKGDLNNDNNVNVQDLVCLTNYLLGKDIDFDLRNGDINMDGNVDIADLPLLINIIMSEEDNTSNIPFSTGELNLIISDNVANLFILDTERFTATQLEITTSDDISINEVSTIPSHTVIIHPKSSVGEYRALVYSISNTPFPETEPIITIKTSGDGEISISSSLFTTTEAVGYEMGAAFGHTSGVLAPSQDGNKLNYIYSIDGKMLKQDAKSIEGCPTGTYVINGRVITIK